MEPFKFYQNTIDNIIDNIHDKWILHSGDERVLEQIRENWKYRVGRSLGLPTPKPANEIKPRDNPGTNSIFDILDIITGRKNDDDEFSSSDSERSGNGEEEQSTDDGLGTSEDDEVMAFTQSIQPTGFIYCLNKGSSKNKRSNTYQFEDLHCDLNGEVVVAKSGSASILIPKEIPNACIRQFSKR